MKGNKTYRHESNPKEKELHDEFIKQYVLKHNGDIDYTTLGRISLPLEGNHQTPVTEITDIEVKIMISTIQWLGSPVGQGFLNSCGFDLKKT